MSSAATAAAGRDFMRALARMRRSKSSGPARAGSRSELRLDRRLDRLQGEVLDLGGLLFIGGHGNGAAKIRGEESRLLARKPGVERVQVGLVVDPQGSGIEIGGADRNKVVIHDEQLGV